MGPGLVTAGLFCLFEHSSFMVKTVVTAFFFCLNIRRFRGYGPVTASSNCLTVRCFRARATSSDESKLDCRRLSVHFVKMEDFDERMSDGPVQMPEQPDNLGGARCARRWLQWRAPPWRKADQCERRCTADGDRRLQLFDISSFFRL